MNKSEFFYLITGILLGFFLRHFYQDLAISEEIDEPQKEEEEPESRAIKTEPLPQILLHRTFRASRFGDLLTPDEVIFDAKGVTFHVKSVFSATESFVLYSDISGVEIFESLLFSTILIKPKARAEIKIENFSKNDARLIKNFIMERLF